MRIGILGAEVRGLACAHYLLKFGHTPIVFDLPDQSGQLGRSFEHHGTTLDSFHHCLYDGDSAFCGLMADLGALDRLIWRETRSAVLTRAGVHRLDTLGDLTSFRPLARTDRIRTAMASLYLSRFRHYGPDLDRVPATEWLTRRFGRRGFELLWRPRIDAQFGEYAQDASAQWAWKVLTRQRWGQRQVRGFVRGGASFLPSLLRASIRDRGGEVRCGTQILGLDQEGRQAVIDTGSQEERFDAVISTLPLTELAKRARGQVLHTMPHPQIPHLGSLSAAVVARSPLGGAYSARVLDENLPFDQVVDASQLTPLESTGGKYVFYMSRLRGSHTEDYQLDDASVARQVLRSLREFFPAYDTRQIEAVYVDREPYAAPVWTVGSVAKRAPIQIGKTAFYLCTAAQSYPRLPSWDTSVMLARETASKVIRNLG